MNKTATIDDLNKAQRILDQHKRDTEKGIAKLAAEVDQLWAAGLRAGDPRYDAARGKWEADKKVVDEYTRKFEGNVKAIQAELDQQAAAAAKLASDQAAKAQAGEKIRAALAWAKNGGDPAAFESAWPGLWQKILTERTAGDLAATRPVEPPAHHVRF